MKPSLLHGATALRGLALMFALLALCPPAHGQEDKRKWPSLREDKLHDPEGPAIGDLQEPVDALRLLPADKVGNKVLWVPALRDGLIEPRTNLYPDTHIEVLDLDIIYPNTGDRDFVRFPHRPHTEWLDCNNCHDELFAKEYRGTPLTMGKILEGEYCGRCHGAVAFPLTECERCHSVPAATFRGQFGAQKAQ